MMAIVGTLAYEFQVTLPVVAKQTFHGGAATYGFLTAAMGIGAVCGGLVTAAPRPNGAPATHDRQPAVRARDPVCRGLPAVGDRVRRPGSRGLGSVMFLATGNSTLQLEADPSMRGRVMALWAVAFLGSTPVGGPLIGWIVAVTSARVGLAVGGLSCIVAAALGLGTMARLGMLHRGRRRLTPDTASSPAPGVGQPVGLEPEIASTA